LDTIAGARSRIIKPAGEHSERVSAVRCPIVQWVLAPILQLIIVVAAVLTQCLDAPLTSVDVNPRTTKHPPHNVDAIEDARLGDNHRIYAQSIERLEPRSPGRQFSVFYVSCGK
jgi:hypothetical protein